MVDPVLDVTDLTVRFGGVVAVDHLRLQVFPGEIVGLIGPNGSGKTTTINCITGFVRGAEETLVQFDGHNIRNWSADRISRAGLVRTFQEARIYPALPVIENLLISAQQHQEDRLFARLAGTPQTREFDRVAQQRARELLEFVGISALAYRPAGELSYGQRKLLGLAGGLIARPKLLLLDEPASGVNESLIEKIKSYVRDIQQSGVPLLIVEHNMDLIMSVCTRVVVLDFGNKIADGQPADVRSNSAVIDAYFGT